MPELSPDAAFGTPGRNGNMRAVQVRGAWERGR